MPNRSSTGIASSRPTIIVTTTSASTIRAPSRTNVSPVSAIVAANWGPEEIPTCARNTVSPKLRSTRFADRGSVQTMPDVRRSVPSPRATSRTPASPSVIRPTPGIGKRDHPGEQAHRRADADRDVAEVGGALDGVAIEAAHRREMVAAAQHADPVAELEHEVVVGQQIGVAPAHVDVAVLEAARNLQAAERHSHHAALGRVDANVVERRSGPRRSRRRGTFADDVACLLDLRGIGPDDQEHIVRAENRGRRGHAVLLRVADGDDLDPAREAASGAPGRVCRTTPALRTLIFDRLYSPAGRRLNLRLEEGGVEIHAEDRPGDAKRVGHAVADRGVLVPERVENRLKRRGARGRAGEHAERLGQARRAGLRRSSARPRPPRSSRTAPAKLAFSPSALVRPRYHSLPYWMPTQ